MKKLISVILCAVMLISLFTACSADRADKNKISVVATVFPEYDWVKNIIGNNADKFSLTLLLDSGVDLHSYQPTADDIITISDCDLFIYVGGESDGWVDDALAEAKNEDMTVLNLLDILGDGAKAEEAVEGMEAEEGEEGEEEETELDEHVWLSLKNADIFCRAIKDALSSLDREGTPAYETNYSMYSQKLTELDAKYKEAVDSARVKTLVFADRFPFRYLTDDYGLSYYAAFPGCSAESEASFETIKFLADKAKKLKLSKVIKIESGDGKIAGTVAVTAGGDIGIVSMDSMQSATMQDIENGTTYLSVMEKNLSALTEALS